MELAHPNNCETKPGCEAASRSARLKACPVDEEALVTFSAVCNDRWKRRNVLAPMLVRRRRNCFEDVNQYTVAKLVA